MEGTDGKETPPLQIDPKCFQDALRAFFQPIKTDDPRLDFYTMYKREATEHDTDYVKKYDGDLNTTLIFAGLFSAVSSAFVIDVHSKLQPDPNEQSAALLRAILLALNQSDIPGETPTVPPVQEDPPSEIVTVTGLMYASLLISLLAAFIAMLGKQWLNRYLRNAGGSTIERCGDRQRKCDGLQKWPFHLFVESLPVMLQVSLLLLACGLCRHMWSINNSIAYLLIVLTAFGVLFYFGIVIAGTTSYECPFQTPASNTLRNLWGDIKPHITAALLPIITTSTSLYKWLPWPLALTILQHLWEAILCQALHLLLLLPRVGIHPGSHSPPLPIVQPIPEEHTPWLAPLYQLWEDIECKILRMALHLPQTLPLSTIQDNPPVTPVTSPWLIPTALATIQDTNANDVRCVSWILWNITDPEMLDMAIRLAATIQWFEDGAIVEPPYNILFSTFHMCFDSTGKVYPGSKDRAYNSARAILWIHILAMCISEDFAHKFPLPPIPFSSVSVDGDLSDLLCIYNSLYPHPTPWSCHCISTEVTPAHIEWISDALLHLAWARQSAPHNTFYFINEHCFPRYWNIIPLNAILNYLLTWCITLNWPVNEEVLKIQDKSDRLEQILSQLSQAIVSVIQNPLPWYPLQTVLLWLTWWNNHPSCLTEMAYEWCSVICENYSDPVDVEELLLSLEIGFRHLNPQYPQMEAKLSHTEHHQKLINIVINNGDEVTADLLHAWTSTSSSHEQYMALDVCVGHLVNMQYPSQRLRRLVIRFVELIGYQGFEQVGVEGFVGLLNDLHVSVRDMDVKTYWARLLLDTIQSSEGVQHLSHPYWELLVELAISESQTLKGHAYSPQIITFLLKASEWDKLECWLGVVWIVWPPNDDETTEKDMKNVMQLLFYHQPSAIQKLKQWMVRWSIECYVDAPLSFRQICRQALEGVQQDTIMTSSAHEETAPYLPLPGTAPLLFIEDDTY